MDVFDERRASLATWASFLTWPSKASKAASGRAKTKRGIHAMLSKVSRRVGKPAHTGHARTNTPLARLTVTQRRHPTPPIRAQTQRLPQVQTRPYVTIASIATHIDKLIFGHVQLELTPKEEELFQNMSHLLPPHIQEELSARLQELAMKAPRDEGGPRSGPPLTIGHTPEPTALQLRTEWVTSHGGDEYTGYEKRARSAFAESGIAQFTGMLNAVRHGLGEMTPKHVEVSSRCWQTGIRTFQRPGAAFTREAAGQTTAPTSS